MLDIISLIFTDHGHCINENDDLFSIDFGKFDKKCQIWPKICPIWSKKAKISPKVSKYSSFGQNSHKSRSKRSILFLLGLKYGQN